MFRNKPLSRQWNKPHGFQAELDSKDDKSESSEGEGEVDEDNAASHACNCAPYEEYEDFEDAIEQDIVCAFLAANCDLNDKSVFDDIAEAVHSEYVALVTREQAMKRGVPLKGVVHQFRPPPSELTLEE